MVFQKCCKNLEKEVARWAGWGESRGRGRFKKGFKAVVGVELAPGKCGV